MFHVKLGFHDNCFTRSIRPEMESSRPWRWPRGASRTTGHVIGLGLDLGLGKHVLGLDHFRLICLVLCRLGVKATTLKAKAKDC